MVTNEPLDQYKKDIEALVPKLTTARGISDIANRFEFVTTKTDFQDNFVYIGALQDYVLI